MADASIGDLVTKVSETLPITRCLKPRYKEEMRVNKIQAAIAAIEQRRVDRPHEGVGYEHELLALRDLLVSFLEATDKDCPESMKAMSIEQVRLLNQLHLAVGL